MSIHRIQDKPICTKQKAKVGIVVYIDISEYNVGIHQCKWNMSYKNNDNLFKLGNICPSRFQIKVEKFNINAN